MADHAPDHRCKGSLWVPIRLQGSLDNQYTGILLAPGHWLEVIACAPVRWMEIAKGATQRKSTHTP